MHHHVGMVITLPADRVHHFTGRVWHPADRVHHPARRVPHPANFKILADATSLPPPSPPTPTLIRTADYMIFTAYRLAFARSIPQTGASPPYP